MIILSPVGGPGQLVTNEAKKRERKLDSSLKSANSYVRLISL